MAAWLDNHDRPVDITGTVMARLASGAFVTLAGCGATVDSCASDVRVFCTEGILRTGVWGERLELQRPGETDLAPVEVPPSHGAWEQFLLVRGGRMAESIAARSGAAHGATVGHDPAVGRAGGRPVRPADVGSIRTWYRVAYQTRQNQMTESDSCNSVE